MRESKLIVLLQTFDNTQLKAFDKFIHSPYFNTSQACIRLWQQVYKYAPRFESNLLDKEKIYKKVYHKEIFNDKKLRQLRSRLLKLVEEFMAIENFKEDEFSFKKEIANAYLDKGMKDHFEGKYRELQQSFIGRKNLSSKELEQKLSLHHRLYFNELHVKDAKYSLDLEKATHQLEEYYHYQKLLYTIEWLSTNTIFKHKIPASIKTFIESIVQGSTENYSNSREIIFENAIKILVIQDIDITFPIFIQVKQNLTKQYEHLNKIDKIILLRLLINYCIKTSRKGKYLTSQMFQLYQLGLTDNSLFQKGLMTNISYINIVTTAIKLRKFDWTEDFINKESHRLYEAQSQLYRNMTKAILYYYKKEYKNCLMLLSNLDSFNNVVMEISKRGLKVRTAFECYLIDESYRPIVYANLESFHKYLNRKEFVSDNIMKSFLNFVGFTKRFIKKKEKGLSIKEICSLEEFLIKQEDLPLEYKQWLLNHLETLKKMEVQKATP